MRPGVTNQTKEEITSQVLDFPCDLQQSIYFVIIHDMLLIAKLMN